MTQNDLLQVLRHQPFEPFRLHLSDGTAFEIHHPDQCSVGLTTAHVGVPRREGRRRFQEVVICSLRHITRLEPLVEMAKR